ncbi:MAG: hypothetical protein HYV63_28035 [Candidatus Schekmanbacteria bacterium]|nr:hypothetical protein [Candidatus Schekmanbacteria bacterium]
MLEAFEKVRFELILDPSQDPGVFMADYRIFGNTLSGTPAFVKVAVANPLARPDRENAGTPEEVPNWEPGDVHEDPTAQPDHGQGPESAPGIPADREDE